MTSKARIAANRANSKFSTGPSLEARERTRFNGVKHGLRARTPLLAGEDPLELDALRDHWVSSLMPRDDGEVELVTDVINANWLVRRADLAVFEHLKARIEQGLERLDENVDADIEQLFGDARGHHCLYATSAATCGGPLTSFPTGNTEDPNAPAKLVARLESSEKGCLGLIGHWRTLRQRVEDNLEWQGHDRLKAIRMLGRQPVQAAEDQQVWLIYVACLALHPKGKEHAFGDLKCEMGKPQLDEFLERVRSRWPLLLSASETAKARQTLLDLADRNIGRLEAKVEVYRGMAAELAASRARNLASDSSPEADRLKRYQQASQRRAHKCLDAFYKHRREMERWAADGGEGGELENACDFDLESGVEAVELGVVEEVSSAPESKSPTEANGGFGASEAEQLKEVAELTEKLEKWAAEISALCGEGIEPSEALEGGDATGLATDAASNLAPGPLLPPVS